MSGGGAIVVSTMKVDPIYKFLDHHIGQLCDHYKIVRYITRGRGHAKVKLRKIYHPPITEEMAYFIALHEIGHVVIGMKMPRLEREAEAWVWALEKAHIDPHYTTRQRICALLVRYLWRAKENTWELPEEDSPFWKLLKWWDVEEVSDGT